MLKWLRNKLREWLVDEQRIDALEIMMNGRVCRAAVMDAVGIRLMVSTGEGQYLIGPEQVLNKGDFWKAWEQRSTGDYVWDDGSKFKAGEMK